MRVEAATLPSLDDKKPPDSSATQQSAAPRQANAPNTDSKGQSIPNQQNRAPVQQSPIQQNAAPNANSQTTNQDQTNLTTVPYLIGMKRDLAEEKLLGTQLLIGKIVYKEDPSGGRQVGLVLEQTPTAGSRVSPGTSVSITELHMKAENFSSWDQLATYAPRFLALWPNIDVR